MSYDLECIKEHVKKEDEERKDNYLLLTTEENLMINHLSRVVLDLERRVEQLEEIHP